MRTLKRVQTKIRNSTQTEQDPGKKHAMTILWLASTHDGDCVVEH